MKNDIVKSVLIFILTLSVVVFTWTGKIDQTTFVGFVSAALMWFLNDRKIQNLTQENNTLQEKVTTLSDQKWKEITENQIEKNNNGQ
jgi:hypothetical protein